MKSLPAIITILLFVNYSTAQNRVPSSEWVLEMSPGTAQLFAAREQGIWYVRNAIDSVPIVASQFLLSDDDDLKNLGYRFQASFELRTGKITAAEKHLNLAIGGFSKSNRLTFLSECHNEKGNLLYTQGDFNRAVLSYLNSLKTGDNALDKTASFNGFLGLGKSLCALGDTSYGEYCVNQYLERSIVSNAWESASSASSYLSDLYSSLGDKELSEAYLIRSLSYAQKSGSKIHKSNMMNNRAMQYFFEGKLDSAEIFFKSSLKVRGEVGHAKEISESHFNLSVFYLEKGEWIQSIEWAEKGEHFAEINGLYQERKDLLELLMEAYMKLRENEKIKLLQIEFCLSFIKHGS